MEKLDYSGIKIVQLFLEKIELLNEKERAVIIFAIDWINHPILVSPNTN